MLYSPYSIFLFLLSSLFFLYTIVYAQESSMEPVSLEVGVPLSGSARITAETEQFLLYTVSDSVRHPQSLLTRTIELDQQDNRDIIRTIQRYDDSQGISIDTSAAIQASLVPLTYSFSSSREKQHFTFGAEAVVGTISTSEEDELIEMPLDTPVFNATMLDELIKALPLGTARVFEFRSYNPGRTALTNRIRVIGSEAISLVTGATLDTWVLSFEGGPLATTLWVTQDSQRLIRLRTLLPNGMEFWKVLLYPVPEMQEAD